MCEKGAVRVRDVRGGEAGRETDGEHDQGWERGQSVADEPHGPRTAVALDELNAFERDRAGHEGQAVGRAGISVEGREHDPVGRELARVERLYDARDDEDAERGERGPRGAEVDGPEREEREPGGPGRVHRERGEGGF